ncbi:MAG TPA: RIP metalloprotease RseP [Cytophagaceae bacterium]|jgi:regulator of sigma E protease|nr:RIP metalloprotease RseP [Cytophagaceae bacterium]
MGVTWVQIVQLFVSLSILITLHELGHFVAAKYFKTRVDKFYLFFDFLFPLATVWNFALFKKKIGETEYGIGWFPLGGYVKIAGMVDESMDKDQMNQPPQPWEYRSKPAWQRLIIIMGGITVNFFLGMIIFIFIMGIWGEEYLPNKNLKYGIACDSMMLKAGLQNGDKIVSIDGEKIINFNTVNAKLLFDKTQKVVVERNGEEKEIDLQKYRDEKTFEKIEKTRRMLVDARFPFVVDSVTNKPLLRVGMRPYGEKILSVNDNPIFYYDEFKTQMLSNKNKKIRLKTIRDGKMIMTYEVTVPDNGLLGFRPKSPDEFLKIERIHYNPLQAIPAGIRMTFDKLFGYVRSLKILFDPELKGYKYIGGFGAMASSTPKEFSMEGFMIFTAVISIVLAFMNFLPIPMLDGGYVVFILYEMITKKQPSEKFMEVTNYFGMIFLLGLMIYANGNDFLRSNFVQSFIK